MANTREQKIEFVKQSLASLREYFTCEQLEFESPELYIDYCDDLSIQILSKEDIEGQIRDYREYIEDMSPGDIVYCDGETYYKIESIEDGIFEMIDLQRDGYEINVETWVNYDYALFLYEKLKSKQNETLHD